MVESTVALLGLLGFFFFFFFFLPWKTVIQAWYFQITLTVIGRPKYAAETRRAQIRIHPPLQTQITGHNFFFSCPAFDPRESHMQLDVEIQAKTAYLCWN